MNKLLKLVKSTMPILIVWGSFLFLTRLYHIFFCINAIRIKQPGVTYSGTGTVCTFFDEATSQSVYDLTGSWWFSLFLTMVLLSIIGVAKRLRVRKGLNNRVVL